MLKLAISNTALKALVALQAKQYKQVGSAIFALLKNPEPHDSKPLSGATNGERRVDVGEYRVIYSADTDYVRILFIGKRNDGEVYKAWERAK